MQGIVCNRAGPRCGQCVSAGEMCSRVNRWHFFDAFTGNFISCDDPIVPLTAPPGPEKDTGASKIRSSVTRPKHGAVKRCKPKDTCIEATNVGKLRSTATALKPTGLANPGSEGFISEGSALKELYPEADRQVHALGRLEPNAISTADVDPQNRPSAEGDVEERFQDNTVNPKLAGPMEQPSNGIAQPKSRSDEFLPIGLCPDQGSPHCDVSSSQGERLPRRPCLSWASSISDLRQCDPQFPQKGTQVGISRSGTVTSLLLQRENFRGSSQPSCLTVTL